MNLENQIKLAKEAAKSDFLWELGMRMPSANQARDICKKLSVPIADEKRVKAVMRLREDDPDALLEIRGDAAREGDVTMVEVVYGPDHYKERVLAKDKNLWKKIIEHLGVFYWDDIRTKVRDGTITEQTKPPFVMFIDQKFTSDEPCVRFVTPRLDSTGTSYHVPYEYVELEIRAWPWWPPVKLPVDWAIPRPQSFYVDTSTMPFHGNRKIAPGGKLWCDAVISIRRKEHLAFALKISKAYEAETARRRKPAKAVVLKNY